MTPSDRPSAASPSSGLDCSAHPLISLIVCTAGERASLQNTLRSIHSVCCSHFELLVVWNHEHAPPAFAGSSIRVVHEARRGLSRARNAGVRAAHGAVLVFTDDDNSVHPDWLHWLLRGFDDPTVVCVTGRVRLEGEGYLRKSWSESERFLREWKLDRSDPDWYGQALRLDTGWGCNMAFRRTVFDGDTWFSEELGLGAPIESADETWMFLEVLKRNGALKHQPQAVVTRQPDANAMETRERAILALTSSSAFHLKLLVEDVGFRKLLLRKLGRSLRNFLFGGASISERDAPLSLIRQLRAYAAGIVTYWKSRRTKALANPGIVSRKPR